MTVRIPNIDEPTRAPDGVAGDEGQFYFWLGGDGVESEPEWNELEDSDES